MLGISNDKIALNSFFEIRAKGKRRKNIEMRRENETLFHYEVLINNLKIEIHIICLYVHFLRVK